jgi:CRP-like cAMP-binding protein
MDASSTATRSKNGAGVEAPPADWPRNRLLRALPARLLQKIRPELQFVELKREQVLADADAPLEYIYFPDSGVISVVAVYEDGTIVEMATIGREGCSGVQAAFGVRGSSVRLLVQIPGTAARLSSSAFSAAMESMPSFRSLMFCYVHAFLEQVMVSVACNAAHNLNQRLARWLLMMRDRADGDSLQITQSLLAEMLGVQRPTISNVARAFEEAGLIERGRRNVKVLNYDGLARESCECYRLVRQRVTFHLPKTYG